MSDERSNIIHAINSPLGFFALSLLIVEGFLAIALIFPKEPKDLIFNLIGLIGGAVLFILVVILVWVIVWKKPHHLTLEGRHYFELGKDRIRSEEKLTNVSIATEEETKKYQTKIL